MAYVAPYIDETGVHTPSYEDIRDKLIANFLEVAGQTQYIGTDSRWYQLFSIIALCMYDVMAFAVYCYNSFSIGSATATTLDRRVKDNGLRRKAATYSTCALVLNGSPGTRITNGIAQDTNKTYWALPSLVVIGPSGVSTVTATCKTPGAVTAAVGSIKIISTPTAGWVSVSNTDTPLVGADQESDSELRARQKVGTALAGIGQVDTMKAALGEVLGVTAFDVHENYTDAVDSDGAPAHSTTAIVRGGASADIASAIMLSHSPGTYMAGDQVVRVVSAYDGSELDVRFYRATEVPIFAAVAVTKLPGWSDDVADQIAQALADYFNSLDIGKPAQYLQSIAQVLSVQESRTPVFSITSLVIGTSVASRAPADVPVDYKSICSGLASNVVVVAS